ncbi:MAG: CHAP domain-containing protein [Oscillospiraceae bacterium]
MVKTANEPVKAARRTVKTADQAARTTAKTTPAMAKASYRAAQAAKASAKAAAAGVKAAAKATVSAVKAIIAATKALMTAILAGGWIAVAVIIIICLIGLIAGSCFGIFFSGEDSGAGQSMQTVVREINEDYEARLDAIQANISYDVLEMSGSRAVWPEVLAIYSVKTTTDPDNAREVATMDDSKKAILKDIFWQMNEISSRTETQTDTVIEEAGDGTGSIAETTTTVTRTTLYITVSHKTAEEMADHFHFNEEQREQLAALLADENRSMWNQVLYGIGAGDGEIVTVALSQVGNVGGEPYWSWYGFGSRVEWCACFVSWCANQCGHIESGVLPKFAGVGTGEEWFKVRGLWRDNQYTPNPGDIIFFDWETDGLDGKPDHVGIVEKVEGGVIYTIEGNSGDVCRQNHYSLGYYEILGFGVLQTGLH